MKKFDIVITTRVEAKNKNHARIEMIQKIIDGKVDWAIDDAED